MGYGPLVRCVSGLTSLWRYEGDEASFSDSTAIHPDHYAARLCAVTALAALIGRRGSRRGAEIESAQAEAILMQIAPQIAHEALRPGERVERGAPWGIYPCAGDDEWCVITARDDADWRTLRAALGDPLWAAAPELATVAGRVARRAEVDAGISAWTAAYTPRVAAAILQRHGVPAGFMQRPDEYEHDPHLIARGFLRTFEQPGLEPMRIENRPFRSELIPAPAHVPAPEPGEHTRQICGEVLGLDDYEIDRLVAIGALEESVSVRAVSAA
jgi:crotonobetainyl-CoA:carnitine CoA-transferase CaiB-like acyl-CoA transferase